MSLGAKSTTGEPLQPGQYLAHLDVDVIITYEGATQCDEYGGNVDVDAGRGAYTGAEGCVSNRTYTMTFYAMYTVRCFERARALICVFFCDVSAPPSVDQVGFQRSC